MKITYQNKVADEDYFSAKYVKQEKLQLKFKSASIINPSTFTNKLSVILLLVLMIGYSGYNFKKNKLSKVMILLMILGVIPFTVYALEEEYIYTLFHLF